MSDANITTGVPPKLGIIGGSGLYEIDGLEDVQTRQIESSFGVPSAPLIVGRLNDLEIVFLPRHGRGHTIPPSGLNFRANIEVLKRVGCTEIVSLSAVGSLKAELPPGTFVIIDQFIDRTFARDKSFFGEGLVAHVSMADPVCSRLGDLIEKAASGLSVPMVRGGTYLVMEGPQFSTRAESELYRSWGCDVIGMTNMPEAKLAREAEMCYATVAMVTDYDCWHEDHDDVTVDTVLEVLLGNAAEAKTLVKSIAPLIGDRQVACHAGCHTALDAAIITAPEACDANLAKKLSSVAGRILKG